VQFDRDSKLNEEQQEHLAERKWNDPTINVWSVKNRHALGTLLF